MTESLTPAGFFGHGSPMNALERNRYTDAWRAFGACVERPRAVLVISAHWYTNATAVTAMPRSAGDPRLLWVPRGAVRLRLPRTRRPRGRRARRRDREAPLGRPRPRQLGSRPRHLVGARSHVPCRGRARRAAVDQRACSRSTTTSTSAPASHRCASMACSSWAAATSCTTCAASTGTRRRKVSTGRTDSTTPPPPSCIESPGDILKLAEHDDYDRAVPTPDHFIPLLYIAALAAASNETPDVLVEWLRLRVAVDDLPHPRRDVRRAGRGRHGRASSPARRRRIRRTFELRLPTSRRTYQAHGRRVRPVATFCAALRSAVGCHDLLNEGVQSCES